MKGNLRIFLFAALALLVLSLQAAVALYTDWLWFGETGYRDVFLRSLLAQWLSGAVGTVVAFAVLGSTCGSPSARSRRAELVL